MKRVLIVEDDVTINNLIAEALQKQALEYVQAFSGTEALLCITMQSFDLVLLDLMLPGMKGEQVLEKIRETTKIPIIIVSAKDELDTKVDLLTIGADDYITKPFEIKELVVRVLVQLRRMSASQSEVLTYKEMKLCKDSYQILINNTELNLTKQEFKILELLLSHPNKVYSKQEMYEYAWEDYYIGEDKTINVHISNIRSKLKVVTKENYIETVWGIGFKLA